MKQLSLKQKIQYVWDYYRYHALFAIFCIIFFCYFILPLLAPEKNSLLSIAIIDSTQSAKNSTSELCDDLLSLLNGDSVHDTVSIDTSGGTYDKSSTSTIKLSILLSSVGENDIIICGKDLYEEYNSKGAFSAAYDISSSSVWGAYGYTDYSPIYACIPVSCENPEKAAKTIDYFTNTKESKEDKPL